MSDKTIDVVAEPSQAVVVREQGGAVGILRPADSLDRIAEAFKEYQRVCETILDASDYQEYEGKKRKKKSAWRKLATSFNVSTCVVKEDIKETDRNHVISASYVIRAYTGPKENPYRQWEAVGSCSVFEKCCPTAEGQKCRKAAWKGHYCCPNGCDGRKHWTHPDHDVKSTAQTRASNRAVADLIGCGEVSAEELGDDSPTLPQGQAPSTEQGESWEKATEAKKPQANLPTPEKPVSAPTNGNVKCATPQQKVKLLEALAPQKELAERYMRAIDWLFPTEPIEKLELAYVPVTKKQFDLLMERLEACKNGEPAVAPYPPNPTPDPTKPKAPPKPIEVPRDPNPDPNSPDAPWRSFPVPFGKHAGVQLAQLDKGVLFGFWANFEVEREYNGKPKSDKMIERDEAFREMLDEAGKHYEFRKPEDKQ